MHQNSYQHPSRVSNPVRYRPTNPGAYRNLTDEGTEAGSYLVKKYDQKIKNGHGTNNTDPYSRKVRTTAVDGLVLNEAYLMTC